MKSTIPLDSLNAGLKMSDNIFKMLQITHTHKTHEKSRRRTRFFQSNPCWEDHGSTDLQVRCQVSLTKHNEFFYLAPFFFFTQNLNRRSDNDHDLSRDWRIYITVMSWKNWRAPTLLLTCTHQQSPNRVFLCPPRKRFEQQELSRSHSW